MVALCPNLAHPEPVEGRASAVNKGLNNRKWREVAENGGIFFRHHSCPIPDKQVSRHNIALFGI